MDNPKNYPPPVASMTLDGELTVHSVFNPDNIDEDGLKEAREKQERPFEGTFDIEKYMKSPTQCGFCGSGDIDGGFMEADGGTASQKVLCSNCGAEWQDYYELKGVSDVYAPDGTFIGNV